MLRITEKKRIKVNDDCKDNPVFVRWLSTLGGWQYWLFHFDQEETISGEAGVTIERIVRDLETSNTREDAVTKEAGKVLTVGAENLDDNDFNGVKTLLQTLKVQVLNNPTTWEADGPQWITVLVEDGSFSKRTKNLRHDVELTLVFPTLYLQNQ